MIPLSVRATYLPLASPLNFFCFELSKDIGPLADEPLDEELPDC